MSEGAIYLVEKTGDASPARPVVKSESSDQYPTSFAFRSGDGVGGYHPQRLTFWSRTAQRAASQLRLPAYSVVAGGNRGGRD